MTDPHVEALKLVLGYPWRIRRFEGWTTAETGDSVNITFELLERIAKATGSRVIDLEYAEADNGYSEYTPGDPSRFTIVVWDSLEAKAKARP